jgi:hypothetical protein
MIPFCYQVNALGIILIFGIHEMGHKFASQRRGVKASWPFFIPAPPGMGGTFGAIISQDEPPSNRDDLFDLGIAGPFFGFVAFFFSEAFELVSYDFEVGFLFDFEDFCGQNHFSTPHSQLSVLPFKHEDRGLSLLNNVN